MKIYDVAIIGGGPAGYLAAERACEAGLSTLLAERDRVGGVCLNEGCIPTKTLLYSGKTYESVFHGAEKGIHCKDVVLSHADVLAKKNRVVKTLVDGVEAALKHRKADVVYGEACVSGSPTRFAVSVDGSEYQARHILIATGSAPILPPIPGLADGVKQGRILTSRELLDIEQVPVSLVVVGGGVIGLEMAEYFSIAGSHVSVIEMLDRIGSEIDSDAARVLQNALEAKGIRFYLQSRVISLAGGQATFEKNGQQLSIPYDKALMSVGRKPNLSGLDSLGLHIERSAIVTDARCGTNIAGIYAAGDVNGKYMLAHVAYREAEVAVNNIAGQTDAMDYSAIPGVVYTNPEVAYAGLSEQAALVQGRSVAVRKTTINMSGRHVAEQGLSQGFCKLVIDEKLGFIIGATLVCAYASEIIYALALMIQNKIPLESIKKTVFPHPTVCEIIREAVFSK